MSNSVQARSRRGRIPPALLAALLSPLIAELLTGSSPPVEFFLPLPFLLLTATYGCGVLAVHELALRWKRGWLGILLLGMAYGVVEEGPMVKSIFSPDWPDLGLLGAYGRWLGVNWVWAVCLVTFHATVSISIPLLIVELVQPESRGRPWLDRHALQALLAGVATLALLGAVTFAYQPGLGRYLGGLLAVAGLAWMARSWRPRRHSPLPPHAPWRVGLGCALLALAFLGAMFGSPHTPLPGTLAFFMLLAVVNRVARRFAARVAAGWSDRHSAAAVTGVLGVFALVALLQEGDPARADDPTGMALVGVVTLYLLWRLQRQVGSRAVLRARPEETPA